MLVDSYKKKANIFLLYKISLKNFHYFQIIKNQTIKKQGHSQTERFFLYKFHISTP